MKFNEKIAVLRKARGLTQEELSQVIGVTRQVIYRWEKGIVMPSVENLISLSRFFEVSVDELVRDDISVGDKENCAAETNVKAESARQDESEAEKAKPDEPIKIRVNGKRFAAAVIAIFLVVIAVLGILAAIIQSRLPENSILYISMRLNKLSFFVPLAIVVAIPLYVLLVYFIIWAINIVRYKVKNLKGKEESMDNNQIEKE